MNKQYTWSPFEDAELWDYGIFDSIEECIKDAEDCDDLLLKQLLPVFRKKFGESGNARKGIWHL